MKRREPPAFPLIGWREWVSLPGLDIPLVKAKVDTGARSSALHAFDIEMFERRGRRRVRFKVHPLQGDTQYTLEAEADLLDTRLVRSTSGRQTLRPVIETPLLLMGDEWPIELTLIGRDEMGFRMLLGRQAVRRRFLVDPGTSFLSADPEKPKAKAKPKALRRKKRRARASEAPQGDRPRE